MSSTLLRFTRTTLAVASVLFLPTVAFAQESSTEPAPAPPSAQVSDLIRACYVPVSGTMYRVAVTGAPSACLDASHIAFSFPSSAVQGPAGPAGAAGAAGANGLNGNSVLGGNGAPTTDIGNIGDFWFDRIGRAMYGPKTAQGWGEPVPLSGEGSVVGPQGEAGPAGPTGPAGPRGDAGARGDVGPEGPQGPIGPQGDAGPAGPQGPQGPQGPKGDTGNDGPQGPKGDTGNNGPQGPKGDTGNNGPQGLRGDTGPRGETGAKGETGSFSSVRVVYNSQTTTGDVFAQCEEDEYAVGGGGNGGNGNGPTNRAGTKLTVSGTMNKGGRWVAFGPGSGSAKAIEAWAVCVK